MTKETQVLFLDDEESILDGLQRLFIKEPYGIVTAPNHVKALEILAQEKVKVVVSDQRMPDIQGVKFLREVKEKYPDAIRILFTGYTDFSSAEEAINIGEVFRFISKPWKTAELLATIRQAIEHYDLIVEARSKTEEIELANKKLKTMYEMQKEFTSTVSHELRTPLASIKTAIDLVVKKTLGEINADQEEVLGRAKKNVDRLKRLIDDILDLTKMEAGKLSMNFAMGDVNRLIQEVADSQKDVAQSRGLVIKTEFDQQIPQVPIDQDRIVQVLNNLVGNALKFTKEGGITVKTQNKSQENHIVVSVIDTGKGIAEEDLAKLFQKFQQIESSVENEEGGTGLGLAISKEIIFSHGGKIWAESKLGEGTAFNFVLPVQERRIAP
jgi:signal transduction histidine kinase